MRRIFFIQSARTCCVSIEEAPFLPLLFTASVSSAESVYASPCETGAFITLGWLFIKVDHAQSRLIPWPPLPFVTSYDFCREVGWFHTCQEVLSWLQAVLAGMWPNREWVSCSICLVRSILAHTSLLMSGGAIPDSKYKSSTYVGLSHPVIDRHALFSSGSNMSAYVDLAHTGAAYPAID